MNILYRKIYCKDRTPNELMYYNTDMGYLAWIDGGFKKNTDDISNVSVCWWFEEVTIPTEEEIEKMAELFADKKMG